MRSSGAATLMTAKRGKVSVVLSCSFFFFQAEDGIRDLTVTGVQTCALPIWRAPQTRPDGKKILERLSRETGGGFFEVSRKQSVAQIYSRIQEELRNQYSKIGRASGRGKV